MMFMKDPKVAKGEPPQQPLCVLNIVLPESTASADPIEGIYYIEKSYGCNYTNFNAIILVTI